MKSYLFVMRHVPHNSSHVQETLDQLLTAAAFDQAVTLLFLDDGVFQLKSGQNPEFMPLKNTAAMFRVLDVYDIRAIYVEAESLAARGLHADDLIMPVRCIQRDAVQALMRRHDIMIPD